MLSYIMSIIDFSLYLNISNLPGWHLRVHRDIDMYGFIQTKHSKKYY